MKRALRRVVYAVPGTQALWVRLNRALGREGRPEFSGWGMVTEASPPWRAGGGDDVSRDFLATHEDVVSQVTSGRIRLSQFNDVQDKAWRLRELMWRHYVVFWSARYAATATASPVKTLAECGVCDGLTSYFALSAVHGRGPFRAYFYDAWEGMKADYLLDSEKFAAGTYSYLSMENTQANLKAFAAESVFVKGFIPESFRTAPLPDEVSWLHIDLNSSVPTRAALDELFGRMPAGGVVLFDDYAWPDYHDTKTTVDRFFAGKPGLLLPMPTGQAMFFKQ